MGKFKGSIALAFSRDGEFLAATDGRIARIWDTEGWREVALLYPLEGANSIAFSADARYLAIGMGVCEGEPCCEIWNTSTWKRVKKIKTRSAITCVRFYHKYLLGGRWGGCIATYLEHPGYIFDEIDLRVWDTKSWRLIYAERLNGEVWCMVISPEGKRIAIGSGRNIFIRKIVPNS